MAIEKTTKYKVFKKYQSLDNGATWVVVRPEETEYMAWEQNSIDCGYIPSITTDKCKTIFTFDNGDTRVAKIEGEITKDYNPCDVCVDWFVDGLGAQNCVRNSSAAISVELGDCVNSIDLGTFNNFNNLQSITIPNSVTSIERWVFSNLKNLASVSIGSGITSLSKELFSGCTSLTSVTLSDSLKIIDNGAFSGCASLKEIVFEGTTSQWNEITKASNWSDNSSITTIHCTDGDVTL